MITKEQLVNGAIKYIDNDVMPSLPTTSKWALGAFVVLLTNKIDNLYNMAKTNPMVSAFGLINDDGLIDSDALLDAIRQSAEKNGKMSINIPLVGVLTFSCLDVDAIRNYING